MIPFIPYMINLEGIVEPSIAFCKCPAIDSFMPIIVTEIAIAQKHVLIPRSGWSLLWHSLSKFMSLLVMDFYFVVLFIMNGYMSFRLFFNSLLGNLETFSFFKILLSVVITNTSLIMWRFLLFENVVQDC